MQLNKTLKMLLVFLLFVMCKGQNDKSPIQQEKKENHETLNINFLDKKYFTSYSLDANNQMPIMSYYDNKIGQFTLYYIGKSEEIQKSWMNFDSKNGLSYEEEPDEKYLKNLNKLISKNLNSNINNYNIIADYIPSKYIHNKADELIYSYPLVKKYYQYDSKNKAWKFLKEYNITTDNENVTTIDFLKQLPLFISENVISINEDSDDKKYQKILLYRYLKNGINKSEIKNILTANK